MMSHDIEVDLNKIGSDGYAPLHDACSVGNESDANYLLFKKKVHTNLKAKILDWLPLEIACWSGYPRIVNMLIKDKHTNLNCVHPMRGSCLHLAAKGDHFQIVQMLLMFNIDFNITTEEGKKAKDVTSTKKILDIIAYYEKNPNESSAAGTNLVANIISEEEDEEDMKSSFTPSPTSLNPHFKKAM